MHDEN
jgi:cell division cycle 20-like protein 1, cofactor of APC complex